ncbi:MAG: YraN family protein, partial [Rhodospirillales bacterium]
ANLDAGTQALAPRQQARIARAAEAFVGTRPDLAGLDWRFDLIVAAGGWRLKHLKDAWRPGPG